MGTKANPGAFDCYAKAEDSEPLFVLLARDELAPYFVQLWAAIRRQDHEGTRSALLGMGATASYPRSGPKEAEADECAQAMFEWHADNRS
jgi:hypothetical protein